VPVVLVVICPHCRSLDGHQLELSSGIAVVDSYRCDKCGHVWTESRTQHQVEHAEAFDDLFTKPSAAKARLRTKTTTGGDSKHK
jgi:Zn ribbon nucleic-acid-binding protein